MYLLIHFIKMSIKYYNEAIFKEIPDDIDTVFLPVNGVGNNMNLTDAKRFAKRIGAKKAVPIHFGMFDELKAEEVMINWENTHEFY